MRTPHLSLGPKLPEFEEMFASYIGVPEAIALSSGTAGLQLSLEALSVAEGDEVILPSFAFIAAANAIRHARATPVFAEIDPITLNLTAESIEQVCSHRTRAILLVHTFGHPADLAPIIDLARQRNLRLIEDACEALGAEYRGRKIGSFGDVAVFSFYPNKVITTGEGGMVVTSDHALARRLRALRNQGRMQNDGWLEHSILGYNCRLSEISCALGISQLTRIEQTLSRRQAVATFYTEALASNPDVIAPPSALPNGRISWFVYVVRLASRFTRTDRDGAMEYLEAQGIGCRAYFPPIHDQPLYKAYTNPCLNLPITKAISSRTLALPFFNTLSKLDILDVCESLTTYLLFKT